MKNLINILPLVLCLLVSCSGQSSKDKSLGTVSLFNGFTVAGQNGGVLLAGKKEGSETSFIIEVSDNQSIVLENGIWKFAAISWEGGSGNFTGTNRCAFLGPIEIKPPEVALDLNLSKANCDPTVSSSISELEEVTGNTFDVTGGQIFQFKRLKLHFCEKVDGDDCMAGTFSSNVQTRSYKVRLQLSQETDGKEERLGFIRSDCIDVPASNSNLYFNQSSLKFPTSDSLANLVHKPIIELHDVASCADSNPITYKLDNGLVPHGDQQNGNPSLKSGLSFPTDDLVLLALEHNINTYNNTPHVAASLINFSGLTGDFNGYVHTRNSSVTADWTSSNSSAVVSEDIAFYDTDNCNNAPILTTNFNVSTGDPQNNSVDISSLADGKYYHKVISKDANDNHIATTACSTLSFVKDLMPDDVDSFNYVSTSIDLNVLNGANGFHEIIIQGFTDSSCTSSLQSPHVQTMVLSSSDPSLTTTITGADLNINIDENLVINGFGSPLTSATQYYLQFEIEDKAGNPGSISACYGVMF